MEHIHLVGSLQPFLIVPKWEWEVVTNDFITKILRKTKKHDFIMVVVEKLTKDAHFILVNSTHKAYNYIRMI